MMLSLTPTQSNILIALGRYKFLTTSQFLELGISKQRSYVSAQLSMLWKRKRPLIIRKSFGLIPQKGRLENFYCLHQRGKKLLLQESNNHDLHIKCPASTSVSFTQDYFHRKYTIDAEIAFRKSIEKHGFTIHSSVRYFDKENDVLPMHSHHDIIPTIKFSSGKGNYVLADAVFFIETDQHKELYLVELYNDTSYQRVVSSLRHHVAVLAKGTPSIHFKLRRGHRILVIFTDGGALTSTRKKLLQSKLLHNMEDHFCFSTLQDIVHKGFFSSWTSIYNKPLSMYGGEYDISYIHEKIGEIQTYIRLYTRTYIVTFISVSFSIRGSMFHPSTRLDSYNKYAKKNIMNQVVSTQSLPVATNHIPVNQKEGFSLITFIKNEVLLRKLHTAYKRNQLSQGSEDYQKYLSAVFHNRFFLQRYAPIKKLYNTWVHINGFDSHTADNKHQQLLRVISSPESFYVLTKHELDQLVTQRAEQLSRAEYASMQKQLQTQMHETLENEKQTFYSEVLPFTESLSSTELSSEGQHELMHVAGFELTKKQQALAEQEKNLSYMEREHQLSKKEIQLGKQLNDIEAKTIELSHVQKAFEIDVKKKELDHQFQLLELTKQAMDIQQREQDIVLQKKHIEVINLLHEHASKTKEFELMIAEKQLGLKEQSLDLRDQDFQVQRQAFINEQDRSELNLQEKILELKDQGFAHKANTMLFEVEKQRHEVEKQSSMLELKEHDLDLQFREKSLDVNITKAESELERRHQQFLTERQELISKLTLAEHKSLNAQNQANYIRAGGSGLWSTVAYLFGPKQ